VESQPVRLLLVDDDEDDYIVTRALLLDIEGGKFELDWVPTYEGALEEIERRRHDLYLLDYHLGERNGLELLREALRNGCEAPLILLTGNSDHEVDLQAMKAGAADYLVKGQIDGPLLERSIRYALQQKRVQEALRESEDRYAIAVRGANDGLWDWNLRTNEVYYSPRWKSMFGFHENEVGNSLEEWFGRVHPDDLGYLKTGIARHLEAIVPHFEHEHRMRHRDGTYRWTLSRGLAVRDAEGHATRMAGSGTDITQRKQAEERLLQLAFHDPLTELPNRALFMERLEHAAARALRRQNLFAVLFVDLDRFKLLNDSFGHMIGDQLLIAVAKRLKAGLRPEDTIARLGGDEFVVLLEDLRSAHDATGLVDRIQRELTQPFHLGGQELFIAASIGVALSSRRYERPQDLLRDADTAMCHAKASGRGRYEVFDEEMRARAVALLRLDSDLRRATECQEFRIQYQPVVDLKTGRLTGFEALARWQHPQRGLVQPAEFIPMAEETGLINQLGQWVLSEACRQTKLWQQQFPAPWPLTISVNLSGKQLLKPELVKRIDEILEETGLDGNSLGLEITESVIMENAESAIALLVQLRARNVRLHIDDFGTGYSSLNSLHRLPVDTLKVDRSFVSGMGPGGENWEIVRTIVALAHNLGLDVIAEGVETAKQLAQLTRLECEYGQGHFFSPPVDADAATILLAADRRGLAKAVSRPPVKTATRPESRASCNRSA
jgi:diguanylate cyclase (GGDEF)-like protein/PAS domain S-box-containing protein